MSEAGIAKLFKHGRSQAVHFAERLTRRCSPDTKFQTTPGKRYLLRRDPDLPLAFQDHFSLGRSAQRACSRINLRADLWPSTKVCRFQPIAINHKQSVQSSFSGHLSLDAISMRSAITELIS
jgi:hypothetical protein